MRDAIADAVNTKRCEACGDRIRIHAADESDETIDDHVAIEHTPEGGGVLAGDEIHYHTDCAPLGGTRIPELLDFEVTPDAE